LGEKLFERLRKYVDDVSSVYEIDLLQDDHVNWRLRKVNSILSKQNEALVNLPFFNPLLKKDHG
jgi:hypothetical protein